MDNSYIIYSLAVAWFTSYTFVISMRIYQFTTFPKTYGKRPSLSLKDLGEAACEQQTDIPAFKVIVPAYMETDVIEGTLYRLTSMNYPHACYEVHVVTYEDEPVEDKGESTTQVVQRVAATINADAGVEVVRSIVTPEGFDGFFPGNLSAKERHIGKARGLNYTLRCIHESNERDERRYFIGKMSRTEHLERAKEILSDFKSEVQTEGDLVSFIDSYFNPEHPDYIGALSFTSQLGRLVVITQEATKSGKLDKNSWKLLLGFIEQESSRFYLRLKQIEQAHSDYPELRLGVLHDKEFLYSVMRSVEAEHISNLRVYSIKREAELEQSMPILFEALSRTDDCEEVFQLTRKFNSRWVLVYDADAEAPVDIMRHLAGRILTEPDVMGFQGPVAPLLNYDSVHPFCRMGALWLAFWHGAAYPRLLHNKSWAHPLAGTNWCFRIEGFEHQNKLIRDCPYDEAQRRFLLTFDPRQLTEDLELGVRNFSEWSVNAAWHPIVEMEQVPPTAGAMFRQYTRWSLGTLQTMGYIQRSRLPRIQKFWFAVYPLLFLFACSGPFITVSLIIAFNMNLIQVEPIFAWWTLFLAFGNFSYIWAFVITFERYYDMYQQSSAVNFLYKNRAKLIALLKAENVCFSPSIAKSLKNALQLIEKGMKPRGFVTKYLQSRCLDDEDDGEYSSAACKAYVDRLKRETPDSIHPDHLNDFIERFGQALAHVPVTKTDSGDYMTALEGGGPSHAAVPELLDKMVVLVNNATYKAGANRILRWSKYHTQISIWAIPFIFFSLGPFFNASWRFLRGEKMSWNKTIRTVKNKTHSLEKETSEFKYGGDR